MKRQRTLDQLAPSIRRAHGRVRMARMAAFVHGALLLALAIHLAVREEPAWVLAGLALVGAAAVPLLGRAAYHGDSFAAFLLLVSVLAPPLIAFLTDRTMWIPLVGLAFAPVYYLGMKGAIGLRGRRAVGRRG